MDPLVLLKGVRFDCDGDEVVSTGSARWWWWLNRSDVSDVQWIKHRQLTGDYEEGGGGDY